MWPRHAGLADAVIAPSAELVALMRGYGVTTPIELIRNGIDVDQYAHPQRPLRKEDVGFAEDDVLAIYVGRISAEKGIDDLLNQFARTRAQCPQLRLLLLGPGPDIERSRRMAQRLGIADSVRFTDGLPFDVVPDYLVSADFFVTASVSEVHPLTVIEALAARLPVVAYDTPGIRETVTDGSNGLLAAWGSLAEKMIVLTKDASLRQQFAIQAPLDAQRFSFAHTVDRTLALYQRLLK
jgi:glycosyltransferase involved in cell wall biosynthesis